MEKENKITPKNMICNTLFNLSVNLSLIFLLTAYGPLQQLLPQAVSFKKTELIERLKGDSK